MWPHPDAVRDALVEEQLRRFRLVTQLLAMAVTGVVVALLIWDWLGGG